MSLSPSLPWALSFAPYLSLRFSSVAWLEELEESGRSKSPLQNYGNIFPAHPQRPPSLQSCEDLGIMLP